MLALYVLWRSVRLPTVRYRTVRSMLCCAGMYTMPAHTAGTPRTAPPESRPPPHVTPSPRFAAAAHHVAIGSDFSGRLVEICVGRGYEALAADSTRLPYRDGWCVMACDGTYPHIPQRTRTLTTLTKNCRTSTLASGRRAVPCRAILRCAVLRCLNAFTPGDRRPGAGRFGRFGCSFDAGLSIAVLHHLSSKARRQLLISETMRVLKSGGAGERASDALR